MTVVLLPGGDSYVSHLPGIRHYYLVQVDEWNRLSQDPDPVWLPSEYDPVELLSAIQDRQRQRQHHYLFSVEGVLCILHRERGAFERMASLNMVNAVTAA